MQTKVQIRNKYLEKRKKLKFLYKFKSNKKIYKIVTKYLRENKWNNICIYISTKFEVDTKKIIKFCFKNKINVFVPFLNLNTFKMEFKKINSLKKDLIFNIHWKVYQPKEQLESVNIQKINAIFMPLVAYDNKLNRIGMGKGYYDKFLAQYNFKNKKIGLAFKEQLYSKIIPVKKFDIKLNLLINEEGIYK